MIAGDALKVVCISAPMGSNGLEGYEVRGIYRAVYVTHLKRPFYKVYPDPDSDYYETCGPIVFKRFFMVIT